MTKKTFLSRWAPALRLPRNRPSPIRRIRLLQACRRHPKRCLHSIEDTRGLHPGVLPAPGPGMLRRPPASGSSWDGKHRCKIIRVDSYLLQHRRFRSSTQQCPQVTITYIPYLICARTWMPARRTLYLSSVVQRLCRSRLLTRAATLVEYMGNNGTARHVDHRCLVDT